MIKLSDTQRSAHVALHRRLGVRPPRDYITAPSERARYVAEWADVLAYRDRRASYERLWEALLTKRDLYLKAREDVRNMRTGDAQRARQGRQDAALLPAPKSYQPRKRVDAVVRAQDSDAYPATVLLDRRVSVKINPRSRRSVKGQATAYEATVTKANGAHLDGAPVCKGQTLWVPLGSIEGPMRVAQATPTGARAKRNAAKKRAKSQPVVKAVRDTGPSRAERERQAATINGHNNVASK